jgi:hypothetical protein
MAGQQPVNPMLEDQWVLFSFDLDSIVTGLGSGELGHDRG